MSSSLQSKRLSLLTDTYCMDLKTRFARCETQFEPITREEARQRLKLQEESPSRVQRRGTPLNDPVIKARLIDETSLENKIIALDYRLKLDGCLQNQNCWWMCSSPFLSMHQLFERRWDEIWSVILQADNCIFNLQETTEGILRPRPFINNKAVKTSGWT